MDAPWVVFLNLDKGYGYGFVNLSYSASKTLNPHLRISDGAENGKYWSRYIIGDGEKPLEAGDRFEERTAFVLFRCSKENPLEDFLGWEKKIRSRHQAESSSPDD